MPWPCFMIRPTGRWRVTKRRYSTVTKCPGRYSYHNAHGASTEEPAIPERRPDLTEPGWPAKCDACDYVFKADDVAQLFAQEVYRADDGREFGGFREAPPGAMWVAEWLRDSSRVKPPAGGDPIMVKLPGGHDWCLDSEASGGGYWVRSGTPPHLEVHPSINVVGSYHGWLQGGVLTDDCEGRRFTPDGKPL